MTIPRQTPFKPTPLNDALFKACAKGTLEEVRALLDQGADPTLPHWEEAWCDGLPEDYFCVHEAACNPDIRILDLLIERGADPNMCEFYGRQPLAYAKSLAMVQHLVELGNDPNREDLDGGTVLSWAALNPDVRVLEFLLEHGAELDHTAYYESELNIALEKGTPERVRFFLAHGSDMQGISATRIRTAPLDNIRVLLENGLDPSIPEDDCAEDSPLLIDVLDSERRALFLEFLDKQKGRTR